MIRIAVAGASGRMGKMLIEAVCAADDTTLTGALDIASSARHRHRSARPSSAGPVTCG